jgi:hypothetical protein
MRTIALSGWLAYAPFRAAKSELRELGVKLLDKIPDREEGLRDGRYAAAPLSTYSFAAELDSLGDDFGVSWACVEPVGYGSDRIVVRQGIKSTNDLLVSRIGLRSQGLEINLFEHLFDSAGLPVKRDYVFLEDRSRYLSAFLRGQVDAVMAPQPDRSLLLQQASDAEVFKGDEGLPRFGLYAILVYRRSEWNSELLNQVQDIVWRKAVELARMDDAQLKSAQPRSFNGIDLPADEVKTTLRWLSPAESQTYLHGAGEDSFKSHLRQTTEFRRRRFGALLLAPELIASCVN